MASQKSSGLRSPIARVLLVLTNLGFIVVGILIIVYAIMLNNSGWLDVFDEQFPWVRSVLFGCMLALGCVVIIIAFMGCAGASFVTKKELLRCYNVFVVLGFILFFTVMAGSFVSMKIANDWAEATYPAANQEPYIAKNFNQVYCYSEAAYMCTAAPIDEAVSFLIPGFPSWATAALDGAEGVNSLCEGGENVIGTIVTDEAILGLINTACDECAKVKQYEKYEAVYEWIHDQCPTSEADIDVIRWCTNLVLAGTEGAAYEGAPYSACRPEFLGLWSTTSKTVGIVMVCFLLFLVIVIVSSCILTRRDAAVEGRDEEQVSVSNVAEYDTNGSQPPAKDLDVIVY